MEHLFKHWKKIEHQIEKHPVFLFLDYDGTLLPIKKKPHAAILSARAKNMLTRLTQSPSCKVALVSGRGLRNLADVSGVNNIALIGSHGFEISCPSFEYSATLGARIESALSTVLKQVQELIGSVSGVLVENKKYVISIHYRMASVADAATMKLTLRRILNECNCGKHLKLLNGKKIIEVRPIFECNKGWAANKVLDSYPNFLPVCIGDDVTDEDMFSKFMGFGINVRVGESLGSDAEYFVKSPGEVLRFLEIVCKVKLNAEQTPQDQ